ncbi:hypothetical protein NLJ89_g7716 [Agrocybe chaxingu]|uniref:Uncharacterized protein n=1 Tax=Agrocybe chaxingu TaxID=84603 RepID=A0A9W8MTF0_9AGAR|nr:hypothetical protein NLJ89_g7716 [Agrocybe chaxingu]
MAYNREWDRGKDTWSDQHAWSAQDSRGSMRDREDDAYSDGKRRKFNNGGYDGARPYDEHSYSDPHRQHHDWSQEYGHEDRARAGPGAFPKKRLVPSEPSPHVIFLGLDPDFSEADMPPPASHGASATAAFYKALEAGLPHNGRRVKIDYSQSATPHDRGRMNRGNMNDGTRDIGNTQAPVLLFRGLDLLSGPQAIYQAMLSSSGSNKQDGAKGMRRIILIKDKVTMASFGFAFVEFVDVQSASRVLAATMSPQIHPSGFRISDRPVAASFAHPYSFQPVTDFLSRDEACLQSTMALGGVEGTWVRYWDESSTVAVLEFKVEEPVQPAVQAKEKKEKKENETYANEPCSGMFIDIILDDGDASKAAVATPSTLPVSDKPVTLSFSKGPTKIAGSSKVSVPGFSMDDSTNADDSQEEAGSEPNKPMVVKKVAPLIASKKTVSNINKWNQVQEELSNDTVALPVPAVAPTKVAINSSARASREASPGPEAEFEFSDVAALMCLLCARQFKSLDQLKRHNKESDLHKKNHKDANLRDIAREKVVARKAGTQEQPKYRDRASERRTLFNQPDVPLPEKDPNSTKKKYSEAPRAPTPPPPHVNPGQDETNVGNKLLKMMGWKEGTGLGSEGDGRVDPIQTAVFAPGAGLGASKGKDIGKYTEGFTNYVHMAQDAARERYEGQAS